MGGARRIVSRAFEIFSRERVARSAAALSYCATMAVFPSLIVAYAAMAEVGLFDVGVLDVMAKLLPPDVMRVVLAYWRYVGGRNPSAIVAAGALATVTSMSAVVRMFAGIMADIRGRPRYAGAAGFLMSLFVSAGFIALIYASAVVILSGEWLIGLLEMRLGCCIPDAWLWMRFAVLFLLMLAVIWLMYRTSAPKGGVKVRCLPGAAMAAAVLVGASAAFSRFVGIAASYPLIYGSLASLIILMVWIYVCCVILITGNVYNVVASTGGDAFKGGP